MPQIRVEEGDRHTPQCDGYCVHSYAGWLVSAAPDVLWYDVQDIGDYQGRVFGVGRYQGQVLLYEDYYGSCSGCGAWGEGGEPADQAAVLELSHLFASSAEAITYAQKEWVEDCYERPDMDRVRAAVQEASH